MKSGTATSPNRVRESTSPMPIFGRRASGLKHRRDRPPDRTLPVMRRKMVLGVEWADRGQAKLHLAARHSRVQCHRTGVEHGSPIVPFRIPHSAFRIHFVDLSTPRPVSYTHVVEAAPE